MKVAFVSDAIYPYNKGGKEKKIYEVSTRLAMLGHDVHVYTMKWWLETTKQKMEHGVHLHAISPLYPLYSGRRRSFREAILFSFHCFSLFTEDFDVIDVDHMPHLVIFPLKLICLLKRKKLIVSWNEVWGKDYWVKYIGNMGIPAYYIEKASVALPDSIISISDLTSNKLRGLFHRTKHVYTVPMGIDYADIAGIAPSKERSDVIFAGRLLENKHVDLLVKAIARIKKHVPFIKCIIVGEGPEKVYLESLVREYRLEENIKLISFLPDHKDLYALFKSSGVFAFPSTREGFGISVIEANACGLPVIVIDHHDNASKDLITKTNGLKISLHEHALASAITRLLKTAINKAEIIQSAKHYDWNLITQDVLEVYRQ